MTQNPIDADGDPRKGLSEQRGRDPAGALKPGEPVIADDQLIGSTLASSSLGVTAEVLATGRRVTWAPSAYKHMHDAHGRLYTVPVPAVVICAIDRQVRIWVRGADDSSGPEERTVPRESLTLRDRACGELEEAEDGPMTLAIAKVDGASIRWCMRLLRVTARQLASRCDLPQHIVQQLREDGGSIDWPARIARVADELHTRDRPDRRRLRGEERALDRAQRALARQADEQNADS